MAERDGKRGAPARPPGSERVERAQHPAAALVEHDYNADGDKVLASRLDQLRQLSYAEALSQPEAIGEALSVAGTGAS